MTVNDKIHGYKFYAHPLSQIQAAQQWNLFSTAMVVDEWEQFFTDDAPDEEDVPTGEEMLAVLHKLGLRFESMGPEDDDDDGYWKLQYQNWPYDVLLYGWAYQVLDGLDVDPRVFWHGLDPTELIFVPDYEKVVPTALALLQSAHQNGAEVRHRYVAEEARLAGLWRSHEPPSKASGPRGDGPRIKDPALTDRIAVAIRDSKLVLSPEEVATTIGHENAASIAAALHQIVAYQKPKRLAGWIVRTKQGRYRWVE